SSAHTSAHTELYTLSLHDALPILVIRQRRNTLNTVRELHNRIRPVQMFRAGVRAASSDGDAPCAPALACDNHESFIAEPPFRLEYERRNCVLIESAAAYLAEILRQRFFGRVPKKFPGDVLE